MGASSWAEPVAGHSPLHISNFALEYFFFVQSDITEWKMYK